MLAECRNVYQGKEAADEVLGRIQKPYGVCLSFATRGRSILWSHLFRSLRVHISAPADFAAFCLNRTQLIIGRPETRDLDKSFLRLIEPVAWNYQNIPLVLATLQRLP